MKRIFSLLLVCFMLAGILSVPAAAEGITVILNGEQLQFDVEPIIINGRTMVPMRAIFEALGCTVAWDGDTQQAIGIKNGNKVVVAIGNTAAYIGGEFTEIDQPPVLMNSRTLVPLRFVSEAYGCEVDWNGDTQTV
ncbi:MAG: copper amine oxidase N-terminal domain-containing protein, partial [Clostridia bacterium]|nr:copper amine oxidase N-terminal domain-containing protein [Clostridia bacterium]